VSGLVLEVRVHVPSKMGSTVREYRGKYSLTVLPMRVENVVLGRNGDVCGSRCFTRAYLTRTEFVYFWCLCLNLAKALGSLLIISVNCPLVKTVGQYFAHISCTSILFSSCSLFLLRGFFNTRC